mmetsp:Transcript_27698/g.59156  ORF Transcript_27698/g.59156 Transcript_27698/m.59156 type:complete len:260 (-) Transcript_27698:1315-2094(-)
MASTRSPHAAIRRDCAKARDLPVSVNGIALPSAAVWVEHSPNIDSGMPFTKYSDPSEDMGMSPFVGEWRRAERVNAVQVWAPPTGRHLTSIRLRSEEKGISWRRWYIGRGSGMFALALPMSSAISVGWPMGPSPSICDTLALLHMDAVPNRAERALNSMHFSVTCLVLFPGLPLLPVEELESSRRNSSSFDDALRNKYPPLFFTSYPTPVKPKAKDGNAKLYMLRAVISFCVNVPVLSDATTVAHPNVSTAVSFLTMAA